MSKHKSIKELEKEIAELRRLLRQVKMDEETAVLRERLREANKKAGFPDNTLGIS